MIKGIMSGCLFGGTKTISKVKDGKEKEYKFLVLRDPELYETHQLFISPSMKMPEGLKEGSAISLDVEVSSFAGRSGMNVVGVNLIR
jgi:hypothetical protein